MSSFSRRTFLKSSALAAAGAALPAKAWARIPGANADIRVAVIGLNGRGRNHLQSLARIPGVRVVALCDVDTAVLDKVKPTVNGGDVKTYTDLRKLFDDKDVDAVTIATPNHWHSLAAIWAMQAGKDVYVEKPVSHEIWEGRQLVNASKKYKDRVIQVGTQIRSGEGLQQAVQYVRSGQLGKITAARGFCYKRRDSIGLCGGPQQVPSTIDYNLWSGPAPLVAPHRNTKNGPVHYDWHWIWLYGNGDVGNQGIHQMDVARWFLGEEGLPRHTMSIGGRLGYVDDGETPNTQVVIHDYATAPLIFEVRGLPKAAGVQGAGGDPAANQGGAAARDMDNYRGVDIGNVIDCEGGSVIVPSYTTARVVDKSGTVIKEFTGRDTHMQNFIDVVRSRRSQDLFGPVEEGHVSSALCHLGNISHRLGKAQSEAVLTSSIKSDAKLFEAHGRMLEHLAANKVDLGKTPLTQGVPLQIDAAHERFVGSNSAQANAMLKRDYRKPFEVPSLG
ncbi:oxidoreductase domain protein (plasmid) [Gemmatirosa kalamazoonensis]|uniref:Oxidoreductase domain protein n=1 Tax=Gemmatirosa kalamazoonensis TaxID=861299 RepID=W0RUG1_9BACT|nr:Gfo/Idh/MocA family oxidoreductase [Gemmatirosa kalamazoonensis]AHG93188.1 oxidoreductase domain protein [Gemmatirosa kalamazoonensis]